MPVRQACDDRSLVSPIFCLASLSVRLRFVLGFAFRCGAQWAFGNWVSGANEAACSRVERGMKLNGRHVNWVRPGFLESGAC